jgi:hypothetical protein
MHPTNLLFLPSTGSAMMVLRIKKERRRRNPIS